MERLLKVTISSNTYSSEEVTASLHFNKIYYFFCTLGYFNQDRKGEMAIVTSTSLFQTYNIKFYCYADHTLLYSYYLIAIIVVVRLRLGLIFEITSHWLH